MIWGLRLRHTRLFRVGGSDVFRQCLGAALGSLALFTIPSLGCVAHNFSHATFSQGPLCKVHTDPSDSLRSARTFALCPLKDTEKDGADSALVEKQLLFLVGTTLEARGLKHVEPGQNPDLLATVMADNQYLTWYVPPMTYAVPLYVPQQAILSHSTAYATSNYGAQMLGTGTTTTYLPGYWTSRAQITPGHSAGSYFPRVQVDLWDASGKKAFFSGTSVGATHQPNLSVSGQFLAYDVVERVVTDRSRVSSLYEGPGFLPFMYVMLTRDGSAFYPAVMQTAKASSARRSGLRRWDIVAAIDGRSTANLTLGELYKLDQGPVGSKVELTVVRLDRTYTMRLQREPFPQEWKAAFGL